MYEIGPVTGYEALPNLSLRQRDLCVENIEMNFKMSYYGPGTV